MGTINKKLLLIALMVSFITTMLLYLYLSRPVEKSENIKYVDIYIASKTIPALSVISEVDILKSKTIEASVNKNAVLNINEIVGKRTKESIIEGEQFLKDRFSTGENLKLSLKIKKGMRAVSIYVNEQAEVADFVKPGDNVDVLVSFEKEDMETGTSKITFKRFTKYALQNLKVLAVGQVDNYDVNSALTDKNAEGAKELPKTVTLEVPSNKAEELVYSSNFGIVRLALRAEGDNETLPGNGSIREDISPSKSVSITR